MQNAEIRFGQFFRGTSLPKTSAILYIGSYGQSLNPKARFAYKKHEMTIFIKINFYL